MPITLSGDGITSDNITSLAASKLTGQVQRANAVSGSVIQTINTYNANSSEISTTSGSLVNSNITANITPTNVSNLICVQFMTTMVDPISAGLAVQMYVNGSAMPGSSSYHVGYRDPNVRYAPMVHMSTFQPSNLSALTFAVFFRSLTPGNPARIVHGDSSYGLKITEIAA